MAFKAKAVQRKFLKNITLCGGLNYFYLYFYFDRFAIRAIRAVSPRNPVWKLANSSKIAKGDIR